MNKKKYFNLKKFAKFFIIFLFFYFSIFIFIRFFFSDSPDLIWFEDLNSVFVSLFVLFFIFFTYKKIGKLFVEEKKFIMFSFFAFLFRFFGECFWAYYELIRGFTPVLSVADVMWYISDILILIALGYQIKKMFINKKSEILYVTLGVATLLIAGFFLYGLFFHVFPVDGSTFIEKIILYSYVVFDIYIIILLIIITFPLLKDYNKLFISYIFYIISFMCFAIFDFLFAGEIFASTYVGTNFINFLYDFAYLFILLGFYFKNKFIYANKH